MTREIGELSGERTITSSSICRWPAAGESDANDYEQEVAANSPQRYDACDCTEFLPLCPGRRFLRNRYDSMTLRGLDR